MVTPAIHYDGKRFRSVANSAGGDVGASTLFEYCQAGEVVWATYSGGAVLFGTLIAKLGPGGSLDMRYQHLAVDGSFKSGECETTPEVLADGRLRLHESWRWTQGATGAGRSIVEEVADGNAE